MLVRYSVEAPWSVCVGLDCLRRCVRATDVGSRLARAHPSHDYQAISSAACLTNSASYRDCAARLRFSGNHENVFDSWRRWSVSSVVSFSYHEERSLCSIVTEARTVSDRLSSRGGRGRGVGTRRANLFARTRNGRRSRWATFFAGRIRSPRCRANTSSRKASCSTGDAPNSAHAIKASSTSPREFGAPFGRPQPFAICSIGDVQGEACCGARARRRRFLGGGPSRAQTKRRIFAGTASSEAAQERADSAVLAGGGVPPPALKGTRMKGKEESHKHSDRHPGAGRPVLGAACPPPGTKLDTQRSKCHASLGPPLDQRQPRSGQTLQFWSAGACRRHRGFKDVVLRDVALRIKGAACGNS